MTNRRRLVGGSGRNIARRPRGWSALTLLVAALAACRGDTLYDVPESVPSGDAPPPTVTLIAPVAGLQVQAGRSVRVQATAADSLGVTVLQISYRGVAGGVVVRRFDPARTQVSLDTAIAVPAGAAGRLEVTATARNTVGGEATTAARSVLVSAVDVVPPTVSMTVAVPPRLERSDSIHVHVTAADQGGSGVAQLNATVLALTGTDTVTLHGTPVNFAAPVTGPVTADVRVAAPSSGALPVGTTVQVYAFAVDSAGNCAAATATQASLACRVIAVKGDSATVADVSALPAPLSVVAGRTTPLATGSVIADLVPDVARGRLYLSNLPGNRVEVVDLANGKLGAPVLVGAEPWGMAFNRSSDTLIVANSGGTNISYVPLNGTPGEALTQRMRTQNADLYRVEYQLRDTVLSTGVRDTIFVVHIELIHFSDRPQFVAQDQNGRVVYSTVPTGAAPAGTIRVLDRGESRLAVQVLPTSLLPTFEPDTMGIINVDSMRAATSCLYIYDHVPGDDSRVIRGDACSSLEQAISGLRGAGSDVQFYEWNTQLLSFSDTSFVAASADHRFIAIAEGAENPGRILLWNGATGTISNGVDVSDIVDNTSEHLVALELNSNGSLGVARGLGGVYYFTDDLRLQGSRALPVVRGAGAGAAIDPRNQGYGVYGGIPAYNGSQLSYVATANHSIKIFDTVNFAERGEIPIRDNVVGPLRASGPVAGGAVATLYGATDGGGVVVVNVLPSDIRQ